MLTAQKIISIALLSLAIAGCQTQQSSENTAEVFRYQNPITSGIDPDGLRDCHIFRDNNKWYMVGTVAPHWKGPNPGVRLYSSDNLTDWIIEGLAEYYSLEILRRSGGLGTQRFAQTLEWLEAWAKKENGRLTSPSSGANTARAVLVFDLIGKELEANDAGSLDEVVQQLLASGSITSEKLQLLVEKALDEPSKKLDKALQEYAKPN